MTMHCVQTALDVLESIHGQFPGRKSALLEDLKVLLRLLRTFYLSGRKWGEGVRCESTLHNIEETVHRHSQKIQSICLKSRDDDDDDDDQMMYDTEWRRLLKGVSEFLACIHWSFRQEMEELYLIFSNGSLQTCSSSQEAELVSIMDSLLHNLRDILQYINFRDFTQAYEDLEENIGFLKNFLLFAKWRGLKRRQMEDLLIHIEGLVIKAVPLAFSYWYQCGDTWEDAYGLIRKIQPVEWNVCSIYVGVLEASKFSLSSHHASLRSHRFKLVDFVDSLIFLLWNLLSFGTNILDIFKSPSFYVHKFNGEIQNLFEGLRFLRIILREYQNKFDELVEKMKDLIGVICDAGIIIFYLYVRDEVDLENMLGILFLVLGGKYKAIKEEAEAPKYPLMLVSDFPQTNLPGFVDSVLKKMESFIELEANSFALEKDKCQTIHDDLVFLRSFLVDSTVQRDQNEKLQSLWSRIAMIAYETEFALDSLVAGDALHSLLIQLDMIAEGIKLTKAEASETFHGMRRITKVQNTVETNIRMPSIDEITRYGELVVGLSDEVEKIIDRLTRGTKQLDIVSIVGMPGLGKTTVAKKVCSHSSIRFHFHICSWCSVSQKHSKKGLLLQILDKDLDSKNEDELAEELYRRLKGKRYLIILDDVWDTTVWDYLRSVCPDDTNGSRILLTSRHHNVALQIKPDCEPHRLRFLTDEESWELLQKKMINHGENCPPKLSAMPMEIVQHCKGLPLMILIVAGILSNTDQDTWEEVAESLKEGSLSIAEKCMKILELSYLHLPDHLKPCFLYFGAFQEDQTIGARDLLWIWIAEGFVEKIESRYVEDIAQGYLVELIQRSLVMVAQSGSRGRVKSCVVHDLLLDFCKVKCNEEHFLHYLNAHELGTSIEPSILHRLSVYARRVDDFADSRLLCPRLRTLLFVTDREKRYQQFTHARHWHDVLHEFCQSKLLRVLDLKGIIIGPFFPRVIESLVHLRHLALAVVVEIGEHIFFVSPSIDSLSNLETFVIEGSVRAILPITLWNLKKLRHLRVAGVCASWELPKDKPIHSSSLENIETITNVEFCCGHTMQVMREFPNICRLKCNLSVAEKNRDDCLNFSLNFMSKLESLTISQSPKGFHDLHFQFPHDLKKLVLSKFSLPWSEISAINKLPNLEVLKLLEDAFTGEIWDIEEGTFPKLKFLKLQYLDLVRWTASGDDFPLLEKLVLDGCQHLKEIPSSLSYIETLKEIEVSKCDFVVDSIKQIEEVQKDMGNEDLIILINPLS